SMPWRYRSEVQDDINIDEKFERLQSCLAEHDEEGVCKAVFDLGRLRDERNRALDGVVERILTLLRDKEMYESTLACHILNFFEFESPSLTDRQKWLCIGFLNAHGDEFKDPQSQHVVGELRYGRYEDWLKMKKPNPQQWKEYLEMKKEKPEKP